MTVRTSFTNRTLQLFLDRERRRAFAISGGIGVVLLALELGTLPRPQAQFVSDVGQAGLALWAGGWCLANARAREQRGFWLLVAAGLLTWTAAQTVWTASAAGLFLGRDVELWDHFFLVATLVVGIAPVFRPDRRQFTRGSLAPDLSILLSLSVYVYISTTVDLALSDDLVAYYNQAPIIVAAVVPAFVWMLATAAQPVWRAVYLDLLIGLVIWHVGQTVSAWALADGTYHAGFYDLPWTVSFVWMVAGARRARSAGDPAANAAAESPGAAGGEWRLVRGGLLIALPAMILLSLWNLEAIFWNPHQPLPVRAKAAIAGVMTTMIGVLFLVRLLAVLRRVEQGEAERAQGLRLLFTGNPHPAWLTDGAAGGILEVSDRACAVYGYSHEEFRRMTLADLQQAPGGALQPAPAPGCVWHWTRDGRRLEVELDAQHIGWRGGARVLTTAIDLTERHAVERERQRLVEQLRQSQKMEAVGRLAGGVAHDFNNILTAIIGYASLAADMSAADPALASNIREIQASAERAAGLTGQLLAFSRKQVLQPRVLDLNAVVGGMESLLHRVLGEDIEITVAPQVDLWRTKADPTQIAQVLLNLAVNARDAMAGGGELRIQTVNVPVSAARPTELADKDFVMLGVSDTGVGMTEDVRMRVFEPFFTTKGTGGTGLGLATAYGIVAQSGGALVCESRPGEGATFRAYFPRTHEPLPSEAAAEPAGVEGGATERILLVEDDERVRRLAERVLRREGYRVLSLEPQEAVEVFDRGETVDLLLSDVVMPGLSGPDVAARLRAREPALRVLFVSGYADPLVTDPAKTGLFGPVLNKPFTPDQLLGAVRSALAS